MNPESFTSLMDLVESHVSKTRLNASNNGEDQAGAPFSLPNICSVKDSASETLLPTPAFVMQLPRFEVKDSDITEVLARQVKNMLLAKENKLNAEKEKQRLAEEIIKQKVDDDDDYMIDLTDSIIPRSLQLQTQNNALTSSSSCEFIFKTEFNDKDVMETVMKQKEHLPIFRGFLSKKVKRGKCSQFGKVLCAKWRPVPVPCLHTMFVNTTIIPFDFSTPSPDDINKEKRLHPPPDPYKNILERLMAIPDEEWILG